MTSTPKAFVLSLQPIRLTIDYTNHKGERASRDIKAFEMWFGISRYHGDEPQWFLGASAYDRQNEHRAFAMKNIHSVTRTV